jgi:hypothetical protein
VVETVVVEAPAQTDHPNILEEVHMSEAALWSLLRDKTKGEGGHWHRVENLLDRGTPDVDWACWGAEGWIELKELPEWPKRASTNVRIPHFSDDQRYWLNSRSEARGRVHLLLRIARPRTYLLFDGATAANCIGCSTRKELERVALVCAGPEFPLEEIRDGLLRAFPT